MINLNLLKFNKLIVLIPMIISNKRLHLIGKVSLNKEENLLLIKNNNKH